MFLPVATSSIIILATHYVFFRVKFVARLVLVAIFQLFIGKRILIENETALVATGNVYIVNFDIKPKKISVR